MRDDVDVQRRELIVVVGPHCLVVASMTTAATAITIATAITTGITTATTTRDCLVHRRRCRYRCQPAHEHVAACQRIDRARGRVRGKQTQRGTAH